MKLRRALGIKAFKHAAYYSTVCHFAEFSCYCDDVDSSNYFLCFFFKNAHVSWISSILREYFIHATKNSKAKD